VGSGKQHRRKRGVKRSWLSRSGKKDETGKEWGAGKITLDEEQSEKKGRQVKPNQEPAEGVPAVVR